ncbi:sugar phosphate nucleotidyltransferase [Caldimonas brevitalea]|uniref:sugar phosphate nucleotidyltransferase n=1 Tax=Caldimonas brevitalea TaxID=413882 RepID=UPI001470388B|nr:sugar phosphate nucleotidyltransferase [Caldimonas brevitalea]
MRRAFGASRAAPDGPAPAQDLRLRRAAIPVMAQGTNAWPALHALPIEMLPVVDRPLIHYAVTEALSAGIEELVFIVDRGKRALDEQLDLEVDMLPRGVRAHFVRHNAAQGVGQALLAARHLLDDEACAVLLPGQVTEARPTVLAQLVAQFQRTPGSIFAVEPATPQMTMGSEGLLETAAGDLRLASIRRVATSLDHRPPADARLWSPVGRCILTRAVFDNLEQMADAQSPHTGDLRDVIEAVLRTEPAFSYRYSGRCFDCASPLRWLEANLVQALEHPQLAGEFQHLLRQTAQFVPVNEDLSQAQARALPTGAAAVTGRPRLRLVRS